MKPASSLSRREGVIAVVCAILVLFWAVYAGVWGPLTDRKDKAVQKAAVLRKKLARDRARVAQQAGLDARWQKAIDVFGEKGGSANDGSGLIAAVEAAAATAGVKVGDLQPQAPVDNEDLRRYVIRVTVDAPLTSIALFIHTLQDAPHYLEVSEFRVQRYQTGTNVLRAEILLSLLRLRLDL